MGVVTRWQLVEAGFPAAAITRWIESLRLHRVYPGVYALGHRRLSIEGRQAAALFYAGRGAMLSRGSASWWCGLVPKPGPEVHVNAPGDRRSLPGVQVHHPRELVRVWHRRFPVTPPAQTLLDAANGLPIDKVRRMLAEADYLRLVTLEEVQAVLGRGKRGSAALRKALTTYLPQLAHTRSEMEELFLLLAERHGLTPDAVNVRIAGWLIDAVWHEARVVVELDSRTAHDASWRLDRDHRRDLDLRTAGYTVLRYTWKQLTAEPELVIRDLRRSVGPRA
jgi:very-short-patch-repair endonuclease